MSVRTVTVALKPTVGLLVTQAQAHVRVATFQNLVAGLRPLVEAVSRVAAAQRVWGKQGQAFRRRLVGIAAAVEQALREHRERQRRVDLMSGRTPKLREAARKQSLVSLEALVRLLVRVNSNRSSAVHELLAQTQSHDCRPIRAPSDVRKVRFSIAFREFVAV